MQNLTYLKIDKDGAEHYQAIPAVDNNDAFFVTMFYDNNIESLHGKSKTFDEWYKLLSQNDPDEAHFIIHKGAAPVAWLKINGILDGDVFPLKGQEKSGYTYYR